ncbi:T9SS type A sorting domain-containing protein [candidate division KSB1 bacterium]|nr:T9SS type A sorting domain-containing protein [candidate division KSB1 bacterium]
MKSCILFFSLSFASIFAYENITPAQVYERLVAGDTLQLLDVREVSEYQAGHIAEPPGMPVLFPANMPWTSGVLSQHYQLLPTDRDIIVNCRSGGRSASASAFLESRGFTRVFNMINGFNGWIYESRQGGYGNGSGAWVTSAAVTIACSPSPATASLAFSEGAFQNGSMYVELHAIDQAIAPFANLPDSAALFSTIAVDQFGLSLFANDTLRLNNQAEYTFAIQAPTASCHFFSPAQGWHNVDVTLSNGELVLASAKLYKWLLINPERQNGIEKRQRAFAYDIKVYPNPFNDRVIIDAPVDASVSIYDLNGRFIATLENNRWHPPSSIGSGFYLVRVQWRDQIAWRRIIFNK